MKTNILPSTTVLGAILPFMFLLFGPGVCQGQSPVAGGTNAPVSSEYSKS